jgi:hypothetical protein
MIMSAASVWFVAIDNTGKIGRPGTTPPSSATTALPRVTTIHVVNWHAQDHNVSLSFDLQSGDIVIDVPKM